MSVLSVIVCALTFAFCARVAFVEWNCSGAPAGWIVATIWVLVALIDAVGDLA